MSLILNADPAMRGQAGYLMLAELKRPWVERFFVYAGRTIPRVKTRLAFADRWGGLKARWGLGRMRYSLLPGLYAAGAPGAESPVFVSANYKMSFDALRSSVAGLDAWILVLDTKGINVWCAAGKGSFGTEELVARLSSLRLGKIVSHRELILPQLGAPGVSAPEVARRSGFRVAWGPVRAADIKAWLAAGKRKDEAMRTVSFALRERMAVAPIEIVHSWPLLLAAIVLGGLYGLPFDEAWLERSLPAAILLLGTVPLGTMLFPALLPWLPSRAFALKGAALGALWALACGLAFRLPPLATLAGLFLAVPATGFLALNFTGSSTFTSQPGALAEVEQGFWPMLVSLIAGLALAAGSRLL
ncbi:MAG TPA: mercury methylation corrinoid protein HgcA [Spirochaetales bacterium]|nr:mercury methylation corrinoid protein HgcA [Spirochaetales bacterium]HRY54959.1 mercury methylation corrinoid protein HgcA [Spirochaetia bacterium]HRZ65448.1 mercury methylation corrinoid protein HgcA [Spirochaetia bacterium]